MESTPHTPVTGGPAEPRDLRRRWAAQLWWSLLLIVVAASPYLSLYRQDFVNFDDRLFVVRNPYVKYGLTQEGVRWAFGINRYSQYHPLTWLSHMFDVEFFGMRAGPMKLHNLTLHVLSTLLLFQLVKRLGGHLFGAAAIAALWAAHPLRVEAVAWVAERKEVLCAVFGLLTMHAYVTYARRPNVPRYIVVWLLYACTLMSKPMLVTLPCVMLLLDYWPLRRGEASLTRAACNRWAVLTAEKLPLFLLVVASSFMTILCQRAALTIVSLDAWPWMMRVANGFVGWSWYAKSLLMPTGLTVLYPRPKYLEVTTVVVCVAAMVLVSWLVLRHGRRWPWLFVGWFGFTGMLVPVLGVVQVGGQTYADRYSYMPHVLLIVAVMMVVERLLRFRVTSQRVLVVLAVGGLLLLSRHQVSFWQNSGTLWERNLLFFPDNPTAHNNLGEMRDNEGEVKEAAAHYIKAVMERPTSEAGINLGIIMINWGRPEDAERYLRRFLRVRPNSVAGHINLGSALWEQGDVTAAAAELETATRLDPTDQQASSQLARVRTALMRPAGRLACLNRAARNPTLSPQARMRLAAWFIEMKEPRRAEAMARLVLAQEPEHAEALALLAQLNQTAAPPAQGER